MAGSTCRRQHVGGSGRVVTQGDRGPRTDEYGTGVVDSRCHRGGISRLDFQVLGGIGIDNLKALVDVAHHDYGRLLGGQ